MTWFDRAFAVWDRFWFTPRSVVSITAVRVLLGLTCVAWGLSLLPDLRTFYFDDGLLAAPTYADNRIGVLQWWDSDTGAAVVYGVFLAAGLAVAMGRGVRLAAPVLWLTLLSLEQDVPSALNAGDLLLRIWAFYFAVFAVFTPSRFLSVPLLGQHDPDGGRSWPIGPAWILRVLQIQLTIIYVATIVEKLPGNTWREGTAAPLALGLTDFERFAVPDLLRENLFLGNIFTWVTIGLEVALPFLLWTKRTRPFAIVAGLGMHLGFDYTMRLGFFFPAMLIGYLAFVTDDELRSILSWRPRRRRETTAADADDPPSGTTEPPAEGSGDREPFVEPPPDLVDSLRSPP